MSELSGVSNLPFFVITVTWVFFALFNSCCWSGSSNQTLFFFFSSSNTWWFCFNFVLSWLFLFLQLGLFISSVIIEKKKKKFYINKWMNIFVLFSIMRLDSREKSLKLKCFSIMFGVHSSQLCKDLPPELRDVILSSTDLSKRKKKTILHPPSFWNGRSLESFISFFFSFTYQDHQLYFFLKQPAVS